MIGSEAIWVRKTTDNTKVRIYLSQLSKGKFILKRRAVWNSQFCNFTGKFRFYCLVFRIKIYFSSLNLFKLMDEFDSNIDFKIRK